MARMSPELQKLGAYFDDLRMRNLQAAVAVLQEGRSIKSVRAAQRVAYFIPRNGFTQESFALQIDIDMKTLRSLLQERQGKSVRLGENRLRDGCESRAIAQYVTFEIPCYFPVNSLFLPFPLPHASVHRQAHQ